MTPTTTVLIQIEPFNRDLRLATRQPRHPGRLAITRREQDTGRLLTLIDATRDYAHARTLAIIAAENDQNARLSLSRQRSLIRASFSLSTAPLGTTADPRAETRLSRSVVAEMFTEPGTITTHLGAMSIPVTRNDSTTYWGVFYAASLLLGGAVEAIEPLSDTVTHAVSLAVRSPLLRDIPEAVATLHTMARWQLV